MADDSTGLQYIMTKPNILHRSFTKRYLKFEFIAGVDKDNKPIYFSVTGSAKTAQKAAVQDLRATVSISYTGGSSLPECECTIYNMDETLANKLTTLGQYQKNNTGYGNQLIVYASTDYGSLENPVFTKVFEGGISVAYTDYGSSPDVIFHVRAMALGGLNLHPAKSLSFRGKVSAAAIIQSIIDEYNKKLSLTSDNPLYLIFKNYGVTATLNGSNYNGDVISQIRQCASDAHIRFSIQNGVVYIWPMNLSLNEARAQSAVSEGQSKTMKTRVFSNKTGMVGYPAYANDGITVRSIFTRDLLYGEEIQVESVYTPACGLWKYMISMQHELSCLTPNGAWTTTIGLSKISEEEKEKLSKQQ